MKVQFVFISFFVIISFWTLSSCDKPRVYLNKGDLTFSADTLKYDSIFTTFQAPSGRLIVYNKTKDHVNISRVWLDAGVSSEMDLIVDGLHGNDVKDMPLAKDDSMMILVTFKSQKTDAFIEEKINFKVGENTQSVLVRAKVVDAYLFKTVENDPITGELKIIRAITSDTTFATDKFTVIDGPLIVQNGATLTLAAGTRLAFTPFKLPSSQPLSTNIPLSNEFQLFSMLYIGDATLKIEGTLNEPVLMRSTRFDTTSILDYNENPGQWRGIWLSKDSKDNEIKHAIIKNGLIGLRVDSSAFPTATEPKLKMESTEIRNMAAYGILSQGYDPNRIDPNAKDQIFAKNCLIHNCKVRTLAIGGGGKLSFHNCTFGDYNFGFSRREPQFSINDYLTLDGQIILASYDAEVSFINCVIHGANEEELSIDPRGKEIIGGTDFTLQFDHCLVKTSTDPQRDYDYSTYFKNGTFQNKNPLFTDPSEYDYLQMEGSPLIDAGRPVSTISLDILGNSRSLPFDIGAYEWK